MFCIKKLQEGVEKSALHTYVCGPDQPKNWKIYKNLWSTEKSPRSACW